MKMLFKGSVSRVVMVVAAVSMLMVAGADEAGNAKALKYFDVLLKRPDSEYVLDRFIDAWLDDGDLDGALEYMKERAEGGGVNERMVLAYYYLHSNKEEEALGEFAKVLEEKPDSAEVLLAKAKVDARGLNFEAAVDGARKVLEIESASEDIKVEAGRLLGSYLSRLGEIEEALEAWDAVLAIRPDDEELVEDLVEMQVAEGMFDEALELSRKLVEGTSDPYDKTLRRLRYADILQRSGKRDEAVEEYADVLDSVGQGTWIEREVLAQIARVYQREQNLTGLRDYYAKLAERYPKRLALQKNLSMALAAAGDNEAAVERFREVLKLAPGDRGTMEEFIALLLRVENREEAEKHLRALAGEEKDAALFEKLAVLLLDMKKQEDAVKAVRQALENGGKAENDYLRLAKVLGRGEAKEAEEALLREAVEAFPKSIGPQLALAEVLYDSEREDEALTMWVKMAEEADMNGVLRIANTMSSVGENEEAYELLVKNVGKAGDDPIYLSRLCVMAGLAEKTPEALPYGMTLVEKAESATDLASALDLFVGMVSRANRVPETLEKIAGRDDLRMLCLKAELLETLGKYEKAMEAVEQASSDNEPMAVMQQVRLLERRDDFKNAAKRLERLAVTEEGRKSVTLQKLVRLYQRAGDLDEALEWVAEWRKLSPGAVQPVMVEADLLLESGRGGDALKVLRRASRKNPDDRELPTRLAAVHEANGEWREAMRIYRRLFDDSEQLADRLSWAGKMAEVAQRTDGGDELIKEFSERRRTNPDSIEPLLVLATLHRQFNNYEERRQALMEAARLKPEDESMLLRVARVEREEHDYQAAKATLTKVLEKNPDSQAALKQLSELYFGEGLMREGVDTVLRMAGGVENLTEDQALDLVGEYWRYGELKEAGELLDQVMAASGESARLLFVKGLVFEEMSETDQALAMFDRVLDMHDDMQVSGSKAGAAMNPYGSYFKAMEGVMPRAAMETTRALWMRGSAYNYRRIFANNSSYFQMSQQGMSMSGMISSDFEELKRFAIVHMGTLIEGEEAREALAKKANASGVFLPELWVADIDVDSMFSSGDAVKMIKQLAEQLAIEAKKEPEQADKVIAAATMQSMLFDFSATEAEVDLEIMTWADELISDDYPAYTMVLWQQFANAKLLDEKSDIDFTKRILELVRQIENPHSVILIGWYSEPDPMSWIVDDAQREEVAKELLAITESWTEKPVSPSMMQMYSQYGGNTDDILDVFRVRLATIAGDDLFVVAALEKACQAQSGSAKGQATRAGMHSVGMPNPFSGGRIQPTVPKFSLTMVPGIPDFVKMMLNLGGDMNGNYPSSIAMAQPLDRELVEKVAESTKVPELKLAALVALDRKEESVAVIDEMLEADGASQGLIRMKAALAVEKRDYSDALRLLDKVRFLPMSRAMREQIDMEIIAVGQEMFQNEEVDEEVTDIAKAAVMRTRASGSMDTDALIVAMTRMGMEDEAKKARADAQRMAASASKRSMPNSRTLTERLPELAEKDKKAAAREVGGALKQHIYGGNSGSSQWEINRLCEKADELDLADLVLEQFAEAEDESPRQVEARATVELALGRVDAAIKTLNKAVELRTRNQELVVSLAFLESARGNPDVGLDVLIESEVSPQTLEYRMSNRLDSSNYNVSPDQYLATYDLIIEAIKRWQAGDPTMPVDEASWKWVISMMDTLSGSSSMAGEYLNSLYTKAGMDGVEKENTFKAKRLAKFEELCDAMSAHPHLQEYAFRALMTIARLQGKDLKFQAELARSAVMQMADAQSDLKNREPVDDFWGKEGMDSMQGGNIYYSGNGNVTVGNGEGLRVVLGAPEEVVVLGWEDNSVAADEEWKKMVRSKSEELADNMEVYSKIHTVPAAELSDAIDTYLKFGDDESETDDMDEMMMAMQLGMNGIDAGKKSWQNDAVIHALGQRENGGEALAQFFIDRTKSAIDGNGQLFNVGSHLGQLVKKLGVRRSDEVLAEIETLLEFDEDFVEAAFKSGNQYQHHMQMAYSSMGRDPVKMRQLAAFSGYWSALMQCAGYSSGTESLANVFAGMRRLQTKVDTETGKFHFFGSEVNLNNSSWSNHYLTIRSFMDNVQYWGVLGEPGEMDPVLLATGPKASTMLGVAINQVHKQVPSEKIKDKKAVALRNEIIALQKEGWGGEVIAAILTDAPPAAVADVVNKRADKIAELPENEAYAILALLGSGGYKLSELPDNLDPRLKEIAGRMNNHAKSDGDD